jgi:hypothetical protein
MREYLRRVGMEEKAVNGYLREVGFYAILPVSAKAFLSERNRPSDEEIKSCLDGITKRNHVMHAATEKGKPKIRKHSASEFREATRGVLDMHRHFVAELERIRVTRST